CTVHFERYAVLVINIVSCESYQPTPNRRTSELAEAVGSNVVEYLNKIRALSSPEDIAAWHGFCKAHPSEKLRNWYAHKIMYPWLLPGFNKTLSRILCEFWDLTPNHTNLVEMAHAGTNRHTAINLRPLEAIQRYVFWKIKAMHQTHLLINAQALDESTAASIATANTMCIHRNPHNSEVDHAK
ncbi:hypothetical protein L208DRAFT_1519701, partial [Tricholoma matsutake]